MKLATKISASFCLALAACAPAWADAGKLTIYGLIDEGVEYADHIPDGQGGTTHDYRVGSGTAASRWGLRGTEDLGGGLSAEFNLESGFAADTGTLSQGGRSFGRQAMVGLRGDFGLISLGRQYTMRYYGFIDADIFGAGSQGLGTLDPGFPNARADNAIAWRGHWGSFHAGANYSLGRDAVAGNSAAATGCPGETSNSKQCREWAVMTKWDAHTWGVVGSYDRQHGGTSTTYGGLTSPELTDSRLILNAYWHLGDSRFAVGWLRRVNEGIATPKSDLYWIVGEAPVYGAFIVDAMLAELDYHDSANKAFVTTLRGNYRLSKRSTLYLTMEHIENSGDLALAASTNPPAKGPNPGGAQNSFIAGIKHTF